MSELKDSSIDCIITSPPYWQLRDYGYPTQWGLEPTFEEYLEHLWSFMDEAIRVLKNTGTAWVNLGDTYGTQSGGLNGWSVDPKNPKATENRISQPKSIHKCLLLIPHRFAIGCIERGWILRNDIIWAKRNGMPESVTDRFSKKHEYFFLFTKSQKYYFDLDGVKDKNADSSIKRAEYGLKHKHKDGQGIGMPPVDTDKMGDRVVNPKGKNPGSVSDFWDIPTKGNNEKHYASFNNKLIEKPIIAGCPEGGTILDPFCGTGTTLRRAKDLGRNIIGIEASPEYAKIAKRNIAQQNIFDV